MTPKRRPQHTRAGSESHRPAGAGAGPSADPDRPEAGVTSPPGLIRVVVVVSGGGDAPMAVETTAALARLGDPVEILRADEPVDLEAMLGDPSIDLVLIDRLAERETEEWLARIAPEGPPSVVVVAGESDESALAAFRAGASDCVHFGSEYERVLPVVLLEQVRRWRADRQRKVSEHRIRWLEDLYAGVVAEMPAALAVIDRDGLMVAVNPEFDRLFPSRTGDAASGAASEFLEARLPLELVASIRASGEASGDGAETEPARAQLVRVETADHQERAFELRRRGLDASGRELLLISDVTESEWLSDRLEALRRDTRDIIENINSALVVVDPAGRISFANPAAERILGGESGDLGGRHVADWFEREGENTSPIEDCLDQGTRSRGAETLLRRDDGHWIPVGVSCSPRLDGEGQARGVVAVFQDLSEIKQLELQVRQTEKMASIGQLAAGVAHEVNNPMGFIHANLHQMTEYLGDLEKYFEVTTRLQQAVEEGDLEVIRAASEDVGTIAREIDLDFVRTDFEKALFESQEGAERIRHIVQDLRDFSRADLPSRSPADVNQAVDSTANIVFTMMKYRVELEKDYQDLPKIEAYPMQLKQVFMNLLVNAYQAIEERGDDEPGVIRISSRLEGEELAVRISDTGIGIDPENQARIFEPFFTTKPVGAGTGLGLSTSYSIIERHGGRIEVESVLGRGTTFEVRLPLESEAEAASSADAPSRVATDPEEA